MITFLISTESLFSISESVKIRGVLKLSCSEFGAK
jgi:hypothetical protein